MYGVSKNKQLQRVIVSLKDKKLSYDGPLKRKLMINFGNLESSSWHFLKTKNKFRFSEDF